MGDTAARRRLVRLAVLPSGLVAVTGTVVVGCVLADRDGVGPISAALWAVLTVGALAVCGVLGTAGALAVAEARATAVRCAALQQSLVRGQAELLSMLRALRNGERPVPRTRAPEAEPFGDALNRLGRQAALAQCAAPVLGADHRRTGVGDNDSCGVAPLEKYLLHADRTYRYGCRLRAVR